MRTLTALLAVAVLSGCAASAPEQAAAPAPAAPVPASTPAPAAATPDTQAAKPATAPVGSPAATEKVAGNEKRIVMRTPPGYRSVTRNGVRLFCKKTVTLGSRFPEDICLTEDQYNQVQQNAEQARQELRRGVSTCSGGTGPSSCSGG